MENILPKDSYVNASEHQFNLSFSEVLFLRDYCKENGAKFCSTMGGCESIRDLQESRFLGADASEFPIIESIFSIKKIFIAMEKVFGDDLELLSLHKIFINIGSKLGLDMVESIGQMQMPAMFNPKNIIFTFDRVKIARNIFSITTQKVDLIFYESEINALILKSIKLISSLGFSYCISGGISTQSIVNISKLSIKPKFIKTGLFTIKSHSLDSLELIRFIQLSQVTEAKLLNLMLDVLNSKVDYIKERIISINDDVYNSFS